MEHPLAKKKDLLETPISTKFWSEETKLSYDDVELVPQYSDIHSRDNISLETEIAKGISVYLPFVVSPMDTVATKNVLRRVHQLGGFGFVHRTSIDRQIDILSHVRKDLDKFPNSTRILGAAIGLEFSKDDILALMANGVGVVLINVAHGHHRRVADAIYALKDIDINLRIVAGNVSSSVAAAFLASHGVDGIRIGIAQGSMCTTAVQTGHGYPMISSMLECWDTVKQMSIPLIADGGIRNSGDMVKALAAGADTVMMGRLFAQTTEAALDKEVAGAVSTFYRGEASFSYKLSAGKDGRYVEGDECRLPVKGTVEQEMERWSDGIRSGLSYSGSYTIKEFHRKSRFIKITSNGLEQARAHGKLYESN